MMLNHRGTRFKPWNASTEFLRDITCPRFSPASKVELGMLTSRIPAGVSSVRTYDGKQYIMPERYEVRRMAARILAVSPQLATSIEDLTGPAMLRPTMLHRMVKGEGHRGVPPLDRKVDLQAEDESLGWDVDDRGFDEVEHLQGYGIQSQVRTNTTEVYRGGPPATPPDPRAARQR